MHPTLWIDSCKSIYFYIYCAIYTVGNFVFDEIYIQYQNLYSKCQ